MEPKNEKELVEIEDYTESEDEAKKGHEDVRHFYFECENPDPHLGCDPGIDY